MVADGSEDGIPYGAARARRGGSDLSLDAASRPSWARTRTISSGSSCQARRICITSTSRARAAACVSGDQSWTLRDAGGGKDHSWGVRNWHAKIYLRWLIASLDDDHGFLLVRAVGPTKQTRSGFVLDGGRFHLVDDFEMRNEYAGAPHYELRRVRAADSQRAASLDGESASRRPGCPCVIGRRTHAARTPCFASSSRRPTGNSWSGPRQACASTTTSSSTGVRSVCTTDGDDCATRHRACRGRGMVSRARGRRTPATALHADRRRTFESDVSGRGCERPSLRTAPASARRFSTRCA